MEVRHAQQRDIDGLATVDRWPRREDFELKAAGRLACVAEDNGGLAAHVRPDLRWSTVLFLAMILVQPAFRGRGGSCQWLGFVDNDLRARGCIARLSSAQTDEPASRPWHPAIGFASSGITENVADGNVRELVYRRLLAAAT